MSCLFKTKDAAITKPSHIPAREELVELDSYISPAYRTSNEVYSHAEKALLVSINLKRGVATVTDRKPSNVNPVIRHEIREG